MTVAELMRALAQLPRDETVVTWDNECGEYRQVHAVRPLKAVWAYHKADPGRHPDYLWPAPGFRSCPPLTMVEVAEIPVVVLVDGTVGLEVE